MTGKTLVARTYYPYHKKTLGLVYMGKNWEDLSPEEKAEVFDSYAAEMDAKGPSEKSWEECFPPEDTNRNQGKW